jgi:hypothetical protein
VNETKRRKVQQGIRAFTERQKKIGESARERGAYRGQSDCEGVPIREKPSRWDRQGTAFSNEGRDWSSVAGSCPGTSRVVSQNVGPVGFRNSKKLVDTIIQLHQPAVILLQDCRVKNDRIKEATAEARKRWPEYKIFMTSSERVSRSRCERTGRKVRRYQMAVATLVHKACGEAVDGDLKGGEE